MNTALFSLILLVVMSSLLILIGPTVWDRILGLDLVTSKVIMLIVVIA